MKRDEIDSKYLKGLRWEVEMRMVERKQASKQSRNRYSRECSPTEPPWLSSAWDRWCALDCARSADEVRELSWKIQLG